MENTHHRHDISDHAWTLLEPHLPGQRGQWGGIAKDNRLFINAVFWILRTGAPWRVCLLTMADGVQCTNVSFVGVKKGLGQKFLRFWRMSLT